MINSYGYNMIGQRFEIISWFNVRGRDMVRIKFSDTKHEQIITGRQLHTQMFEDESLTKTSITETTVEEVSSESVMVMEETETETETEVAVEVENTEIKTVEDKKEKKQQQKKKTPAKKEGAKKVESKN